PQQLEQPQQGAHPENSDVSGLEHLMDGRDAIPEDKGIFLGKTWRLPKSISEFTSSLYYEGKLRSHQDTSNQIVNGSVHFQHSGLYYLPVDHQGNQNSSIEEIDKVEHIVNSLLSSGVTWVDREGKTRALTKDHFRIVAPYNVQVNALKERLPGFQIGTVDKFQGQQAPVVIYSMTSSSSEDAPRGMGFLYDPHRLNVATSRAQCVSIMVASPKLFEAECHSIEQMKMANGMCLYKEMAEEVRIEP
ncbi:MAG: C-terminal helicase domain-containing protein, partial [Opitutae bacterium]